MTQRTWLITGCSRGLGRELMSRLLAQGDRVAATARHGDGLAGLTGTHGDRLWTAELDVSDATAIRRVVDAAFTELGTIDVAVSNAGYGLFGAAEELDDEQIRDVVDTNLIGSIQFARAVLTYFRAQGQGRFMQISSSGGQVSTPGMSLYNATKWGIEGFCEALAAEVAEFGIGVTIVEPGGTRTNFNASMRMAQPLAAYDRSSIARSRRFLLDPDPEFFGRVIVGDTTRVADAVIRCASADSAPLRLTLGSDSYEQISTALTRRLAALTAQRDIAYGTDHDDAVGART